MERTPFLVAALKRTKEMNQTKRNKKMTFDGIQSDQQKRKTFTIVADTGTRRPHTIVTIMGHATDSDRQTINKC